MDTAINSITGEIVNAWTLEINSSYQFIKEEKWYADPNNIQDYDKNKIKDIKKIEVRYRKGNDNVINKFGTEYAIAPCFFIPNKTELGINVVPESKEHKLAKNWIYNRIKNKSLEFQYSTISRPFEYDNKLNIKDFDVDFQKVGIEVNIKNNKVQRADIIIPFKEFHNYLGKGIVIEIQFSRQYEETTKKRSYGWAFKGFSICWIWENDFENLSEDFIELKEDRLVIDPLAKLIEESKESNERDLRWMVQDLSRQIDKKMKELNFPFCIGDCKKCNEGYMTKKKSKQGNSFYGCSNYPLCRHTIAIPRGVEDETN